MLGIIFAAGIGSRLKPFTDFHPKALAELGGKPSLIRVCEKLLSAGARGLIVNVHHFPEQIVDCLKAQPFADRIEISDESSLLLDTGGALAKIARESRLFADVTDDEPILVHNSDIYTDFPIEEMIEAHRSTDAAATILIDPNRFSTRHFLFDKECRLCGWDNTAKGITRPEGLDTSKYLAAPFGGVHVLSRSTISKIEAEATTPIVPFGITNWYIDNCSDILIHGFIPSKPYRWHDIGTPEKLVAAQTCF